MNGIFNSRIFRLVFGLIFIAGGIFTIVISGIRISKRHLYDSTTKAVISEIEEELDYSSDTINYTYTVFVDYEVDGKRYEHVEFPAYNSSMQEGASIDILYRSDDPGEIETPDNLRASVIGIVIGAVAVVAGTVIDIKGLKER